MLLTIRATSTHAAILPLIAIVTLCGTIACSVDRDEPTVAKSPASAKATPAEEPCGQTTDERPGAGWPSLFGPLNNSTSPETGLLTEWPEAGPSERWRRSIGRGYSAPVVLGERGIAFGRQDESEVLDCFDSETGETRWEFRYPTAYSPRTAYSDGPYSTPVLDEGRVYAIGAEGKLHCLDLTTGRVIWQRWLTREYRTKDGLFAVAASPLVEKDRLILQLGAQASHAGIVAVDKATGKTLWTATNHAASCATPCAATIHGTRYLFVWTDPALVCLDPSSGQVRWSLPFRAKNPETVHATSPVVSGDLVVVSGYQLGTLCVRVLPDGRYEQLWRSEPSLLDSQYNNLLCWEGHLYGFSTVDHTFRCVELSTGRLKWKWRSKVQCGASIAVDGSILLFGEHGRLGTVAIDASKPVPVAMTARPVLKSPCFTAPALSGGLLYLRNEETLLCLDLRKPSRQGETMTDGQR